MAKDKLSALVDEANRKHEIVRITRHGHGAAILMSEDDLESLRETLFWLSQPGVRKNVDLARAALTTGHTTSGDDLRAQFGLSN